MFKLSVSFVLLSLLASYSNAQQVGTNTAETHPPLQWSQCTASGCTTQSASIVLDGNWRWLHDTTGYTNCYTGSTWDATLCPDPTTCAKNCALDGAAYSSTYGITTTGNSLTLDFVTGSNVGSRVYLMDTSNKGYEMFNLLNREFTFTVDVSTLPCGLNGAVYFSQMDSDGGAARFPSNTAGAKYGTGYCDSQCPHDIKFIDGVANLLDWNSTSANSGTGEFGTCCSEMDIWEANSISAAVTPHPCSVDEQTQCGGSGVDCTTACDQAGCDFNSYRMGDLTFYGPGETVDTTKPFTIVTQFLTDDGTDTGNLHEIKRFYVQNNVVIPNSQSQIAGVTGNSITDDFCTAQKAAFGDTDTFAQQGGLVGMGNAFKAGMVLVLSIWDDYAVDMLWLDSDYPTTKDASSPGVARGTCATTSGVPATVEANAGSVHVVYSNIKVGTIGSTFPSNQTTTTTTSSVSSKSSTTTIKSSTTKTSTTTTKSSSTTTHTSSGPTATHYGQCGGTGYTGPTVCASPYTCNAVSPPYYYQCL